MSSIHVPYIHSSLFIRCSILVPTGAVVPGAGIPGATTPTSPGGGGTTPPGGGGAAQPPAPNAPSAPGQPTKPSKSSRGGDLNNIHLLQNTLFLIFYLHVLFHFQLLRMVLYTNYGKILELTSYPN